MHSFLVSTPPNFPPAPDCLEIIPETSVGIDEVRAIQTFLSRKPLQADQNTVIIHQAEKLTLPAQHALLKTLEEPPGNAQIYLVTAYPDMLLPTILSRVQVNHASMHRCIDASTLKASSNLMHKLLSAKGVGERLKLLDEAAFTRETALEFLDHLEHILHSHLDLDLDYQLIVDTRKYLTANVSLRLALDHFALNL
jgi:hypothetical protein